jgi:hypothetical protein
MEVLMTYEIASCGGRPSDRPADRRDWRRQHTFPPHRRSDLHAKPTASGSVARRTCACRSLADTGLVALRYVDEANLSNIIKWFARGSIPLAAILISGGLLPSRAFARRHDAERVHLSRFRWRSIAGCRCARSRHRRPQAPGTQLK